MRVIVAIGACTLVMACAGTKQGADSVGAKKETVKVESVVIDATRPPEKLAGITIGSIRTSGDTLLVDVVYSGGCKPHDFKLYSTGMWMKSMPPKVNVWLSHTVSEPDPCRQVVKETLRYLIRPLRYRGQDKVVILMQGTEHQADYTYPKD
jgi:hypothetical protein